MLRMWTACWRSSTCPRSKAHQHCAGNAVRKMRKRCLQVNEECTDSLPENCCGLTELTCAVRWRKRHQALDVRPTTLSLEAVKRAPVGSVFTYRDGDWTGDADLFSVSGTVSWLRGKVGWYPITASSRKQSTIALSCGEAELVATLSGECEGNRLRPQWYWLVKFGSAVPRKRVRLHNRSCAAILLQRWV